MNAGTGSSDISGLLLSQVSEFFLDEYILGSDLLKYMAKISDKSVCNW